MTHPQKKNLVDTRSLAAALLRGDLDAPTVKQERLSFSITEWCERHGVSRGSYYRLRATGRAPKIFYVGDLPRITIDADRAWTREREKEADEARPRVKHDLRKTEKREEPAR